MRNSTHSLYPCLLLLGVLVNLQPIHAQVAGLSFRPVDAAYSLVLDRIILISANPDQLHIYDPVASYDQTVALPSAPQSVCLSPDGTHAGVAFANAVDYIDLQGATVTNTYPNVAVGTGKVVCGSGYIYLFPSYGGFITSIDIATGNISSGSNSFDASGGTFDSAVNAIYTTQDGMDPDSLQRFDTSAGVVGTNTPQPPDYFSVFPVCGPLLMSQDGSRIYSACGAVYRASNDPTQDMRYLGTLPVVSPSLGQATSDLLDQIAVIPKLLTFATDTVVNLYSASSLNPVGQFATTPFQVGSSSFPAHGRWVFYNSSSSAMFIITQADSSAGLLRDYAIENIKLTNPNSCTAAFAFSSVSVVSAGSYGATPILSGTDCAFTGISNVPWIVLSSGYYGSGNTTLIYLVRPNLSATPRSGTISMGSETLTINQDAAGPASSLTPLSFRPVVAEYDKTLDKIVMVSALPDELHIYDPISQADQIVPLGYMPLSLAMRPDGLVAAVGHRGHVSIVDLTVGVVSQTVPLDMDVYGIALSENGYAYGFPIPGANFADINSIQLSTGLLSTISDTYYGNVPRLDASGEYLYVAGYEGSSKFDISTGPAKLNNASFGPLGGNIWLSEDGTRIIDVGGKVFFTSVIPAQDLQPDGSLTGASYVDSAADSYIQQQIAVLTDPSASSNTQLQLYASNGLALLNQTTLPGFLSNGISYVSHGRYVFWNAAASKLFAITEADGTSALISDFAVNTITPPNSPPACTYSVLPNSLDAPAFYASSWVFDVTSNCVWLPIIPSSNWLTPGLPGTTAGDGSFTLNVQSNPGEARTGSIMVGDQTVTITQNSSTCGYSLAALNAFFPRYGGIRTVNLLTSANCSWSVQSDSPWLTVISSPSGTGSAAIEYSVAPDPSLVGSRFGTLDIAGFAYRVVQRQGPNQISSFDVWRPSNGTWFLLDKANTGSYPMPTAQQQWGLRSDIPVPGDYDGDGKTDYAVWRPSNGTWFVLLSSSPESAFVQQWGLPGDIPVPGDYDGDGRTDFAVWRPSTGTWFVLYFGATYTYPLPSLQQQWGLPGDIPVPGDYNGDGEIDFAVWRPSTGTWFVLYNGATNTYPNPSIQQQWGLPGDVPLVSDFNGDGNVDFAVWRPSSGTWFVLYNGATNTYPNPSLQQQWGLPGDVPLAGDFNGDGNADFVVWRPSNGTWFVLYNGATDSYPYPSLQQQWGLPGDVPIAAK